MNRIDKLIKVLIGSCLLAAGLGGQAWAEVPCSSSTDGDGLKIGVTGGSASCEAWGLSGCFVKTPGGSCTANDAEGFPMFTVTTEPVNSANEVSWSIEYAPAYNEQMIGAIDVSLWEGAKKGQNYPFVFRWDVGLAPDEVSMTCNEGTTAGIHFCMDGIAQFSPIFENPGQPTVGSACDITVDVSDFDATIYGVDINVLDVAAAQGLTIVSVARTNRPCASTPGQVTPEKPLCTHELLPDFPGWEPDPAFGFVEDGQITLKNLCLAQSGEFVTEPQCDPDKEVVNGPFIDSLAECSDRAKGIIREEVSIGFEGSGYVGYGGSRRYY